MNHLLAAMTGAILTLGQVAAATYHVAKSGRDSNPGTQTAPWLTIGKAANSLVAGDTVVIGDGDYNEHVRETTAGTAGAYITYKAANQGMASLRAFRLSAPFIKLDGFKIDRYSGVGNTWAAAVRIESNAHHTIVTNCHICDLPWVIAHDFSFNAAEQRITSPSSDFIAAGFLPGSKIYLGASGATIKGVPLYYANHDTTWTVSTVAKTSMTLSNGSAPFLADAGKNYWAFVRAGSGNSGFYAISAVISGGLGPSKVTLTNNRISNWAAHAIDINGEGFLLEGNKFTSLKSFRFLSFSGSNHVIRRNIIRNSPGVLHYTKEEVAALIHPPGTGWYDYQVGMMSGFAESGAEHKNVLVEQNWFENIENQLGRVDDELPGAFDITYNKNIFIGVSEQFSGGRDGMKWTNNTFYKCAFGTAGHPLSIGGRPPVQSGYEIRGNLFIACGRTGLVETDSRGYYSISDNAVSPVADLNMVASEEVTGFAGKSEFTEPNGVNGGDPVFYAVTDFLGPDGEPFTADDGLQVLPNSPAARLGGGALGVYKPAPNVPVAHFRLSSPQGWFEPPGDEYNPSWVDQLPTKRGVLQRPYDTVPSIGNAPVTASFTAEKSISGVGGSLTNADITQYSWDFGDGKPPKLVATPMVSHVFSVPGNHVVTLTVTNSRGNSHSFRNTYRVTGTGLGTPPAPPKNLRLLGFGR